MDEFLNRWLGLFVFACGFGVCGLSCGKLSAGVSVGPTPASEMVYYVLRTDDGRLFPSARGFGDSPWELPSYFDGAGSGDVTWQAIGLSGKVHGGGKVKGSVRVSSSIQILFEDSVRWHGIGPSFEPGVNEIILDSVRSLEWLVLGGLEGRSFPRHFRIMSALSPKGPWHEVPSAVYPFFPYAEEDSIWIPLHSLAAGALKVVIPHEQVESDGWGIGTVQVLGEVDLPWRLGDRVTVDAASLWNLWLHYGNCSTQVHEYFDTWRNTERPLDGGRVCIGSCEWLYWGAKKVSWLGDNKEVDRLESYIVGNPIDDDGRVWAAPNSPKHLLHSVHYVNNAIYPMAVAHHYLMQRKPGFLEKRDSRSGKTVLEKARLAMDYQLDQLGGIQGMVTLTDTENDGTSRSYGSNYWDFWLFGYQSAYTNVFFYESLQLMAEFEEALGNTVQAEFYRDLMPNVKMAFNELFWDESKGRYIGWVDREGKRHDYGFTFVNVMALALGLSDATQSEQVLKWLDGERIVDSDDSKGKDIYAFGFAPRTNTVDARHAKDAINSWNGALDVDPGGSAAFGQQIQNGGAVFYVSYYDLHARRAHGGWNAVEGRLDRIVDEFQKDALRRDPANSEGASDILGILREFPESGLVPYFYIEGVIGASVVAEGIQFNPCLATGVGSASVDAFAFNGKVYKIVVEAELEAPFREDGTLRIPATRESIFTVEGEFR